MFHLFPRLRAEPHLKATYLGLALSLAAALPQLPYLEKVIPSGVRYAVVLLFFSLLVAQGSFRLFVNRATVLLGRISFSVYLTHFVALHLVLWGTRGWYVAHFQSRPPFGLAFPCVLALTTAISTISYRLVEVPGQRLGRRLIQRLELYPSRSATAESEGVSVAL
jgi:peptidoglycan/LPS O-acetylase OafA/YrhL